MADPIAIWGAVTGTLGFGLAAGREAWGRKRSLRVTGGWQHKANRISHGHSQVEVWICVVAFNNGRRPLHIERAGWLFSRPVDVPHEVGDEEGFTYGEDDEVRVIQRVEINFSGETFEVFPDGPNVRMFARIEALQNLGIDPMKTEVLPYVVTSPNDVWQPGQATPLLPKGIEGIPDDEASASLKRTTAAYAVTHPQSLTLRPNAIYSVPRLVLEGDVERVNEVATNEMPSSTDA